MSQTEEKLLDEMGTFTQVVKDGTKLGDVDWQSGRILLSNRRLILAGGDGKRTIRLSEIRAIEGRYDVNQTIAKVSEYVSVRVGADVFLVSIDDSEQLEKSLFSTLLDGTVMLVKHPAVEGGVIQDTEWQKARIKIGDDAVNMAVETGEFVQVEIDDVGSIERKERTVRSKDRPVIEVEHTVEGTSVMTYISGGVTHCSVLSSVLARGAKENSTAVDLGAAEKEVLMALYSGVSSFEVPEFLGMDPDEVEEMYERLVELEILQEVRLRREVALKPRGRNIASESMNDQ